MVHGVGWSFLGRGVTEWGGPRKRGEWYGVGKLAPRPAIWTEAEKNGMNDRRSLSQENERNVGRVGRNEAEDMAPLEFSRVERFSNNR